MNVVVDYKHKPHTIQFDEFTVHCPPVYSNDWINSILRDTNIDLGNGLTCNRLGGECRINNGCVVSTDVLIIIYAIYSSNITTESIYKARFSKNHRDFAVEIIERDEEFWMIDECILQRSYERVYGKFRSIEASIIDCKVNLVINNRYVRLRRSHKYTFKVSKEFYYIELDCKGGRYRRYETNVDDADQLQYEIAFAVLDVLRRCEVKTFFRMEANELIIGDHYATITSLSSATEFVESLFRSRAKSAMKYR
jgi:hypothetical protein